MFQNEPGWEGAFTRAQDENAMPNGTRIVKTNSEEGDANPDGTPGVILGSISHPEVWNGAVMYFVEWASKPRCAIGIMAKKVRAAE